MDAIEIDKDIHTASTLPATFYTNPDWYDISKEKVFAKSWQFCFGAEELRLEGQLIPFTLLPGMLDEPLLFIRDTDNKTHCVSNVCTHRGNLLVEGPCIQPHIRCRYHGRRFNLQGNFIHMPEFEKAKDFPTTRDNLPQIPFDNFGEFIFASLAPTVPFNEVFKEIHDRIGWMPFNEMRFDEKRSRDYLVKSHWALYCENYLEGLHIPFIHRALRSVLDFANYSTEINRYSNLQLAYASSGEDAFELPKESQDYGKPIGAYYYWIFPNTMLNFYPWGCSVNVVKPMGPSLTKVSFLTFVKDESKLNQGAGGDLDKVEREDESVVESVQRGIRSRFYTTGRYSPTREQGTHHFHRLLAEFLA